eukprot:CAMPEP_0177713926 /NCGR_PEP_ID=MMETSP0484_2-20121128/13194_1 /TAXON_ID=354590 /ORGANISM="Rhodomonas lens, Strain RHODO" /LENGTH=93 /DNA_ID=CAMNT_0019225837 /DNA_START=81 /DNA_END=362 /DNA_ORIENTATION=+
MSGPAAAAGGGSLKHFVMKSAAITLFRDFCRSARRMPPTTERREMLQMVRSEYQKYHKETDLQAIDDALVQGKIAHKRFDDMVTSMGYPKGGA